ncbi:MAG: (d)CMP kinase [Elusimicrobiales bacterium]|jgi:cytidylate kinase
MTRRPKGIIIAIDGPAGVGKSTIGKMVAARLNYSFISTGKMYRALAWKALAAGTDLEDEAALMALARAVSWELKPSGTSEPQLCVDGRPLDREITDETVGKASSVVSKSAGVRRFMVDMQRAVGAGGGVVMEGRDIGTNVFPDAELKIYLDASPEARAGRRVGQLRAQGLEADGAAILDFIVKRDEQDSRRKNNPLKRAEGGHYIDSTLLDREQVVTEILRLCAQVMA